MMTSLVIKDILIQKKAFATAAFFGLCMVFAFGSMGMGAYLMSSMGIVFLLIAGAFMYDEKSKGDILINSLPVSRKDIVAARYLSLIVFSVLAIIIASLAGMIIKTAGYIAAPKIIDIPTALGILLMLCVVYSFYIPIYFKFGYIKSRIVNVVLYVAIFGLSGLISGVQKAIAENPNDALTIKVLYVINSIPSWMIGPILLILTLIIILISMGLSIKFYLKKEF